MFNLVGLANLILVTRRDEISARNKFWLLDAFVMAKYP